MWCGGATVRGNRRSPADQARSASDADYHHHCCWLTARQSPRQAAQCADHRGVARSGRRSAALVGALRRGEFPSGYCWPRRKRRTWARRSDHPHRAGGAGNAVRLIKAWSPWRRQGHYGQRSQALMQKRILFQGIAILLPCLRWSRAARPGPAQQNLHPHGDAGETGLVDGSRASKADPRFAAIGDVDEATARSARLCSMSQARTRARCSPASERIVDLGGTSPPPSGEGALHRAGKSIGSSARSTG